MQEASGTGQHYFRMLDTVSIGALLLRIGILLVTSVVFWNCGPWIERVLLPAEKSRRSPS
jgi:hypothetical protein